jgi:hypothetical protein
MRYRNRGLAHEIDRGPVPFAFFAASRDTIALVGTGSCTHPLPSFQAMSSLQEVGESPRNHAPAGAVLDLTAMMS